MSQQPPPEHPAPPPAMTGFTVTGGFSVIPPKRPITVTAASWLMLGIAALAVIGAFAFVIVDLIHIGNIFDLFSHEGFWYGMLLVLIAIGTGVTAMLVRNASSGAQIGAWALLGAMTVLLLATGIGDLVEVPFVGAGDTQVSMLLLALLLLVAAALTTAPVVLLAVPTAARWFRERRREVTFIDPAEPPARPVSFVVAVAFMTLTGLLEIANIAVYAGWLSPQGVDFLGSEGVLVGYFVTVGMPVLLVLAVSVGLAFASDAARVVAYGACGYYVYNGPSSVAGFVLRGDVVLDFSWVYYLDIAMSVVTAVTAGVVLFALSGKQLVQWFDDRREPAPEPEPSSGPIPTGQE